MSGYYANLPGTDLAALSARWIIERHGDQAASAVILLPTRRAVLAMRDAFRQIAGDATQLLPRMISLADIGDELITLLGADALPVLGSIPPAMAPARRIYLLAAQVRRFEQARGGSASLDHAIALAENLAELQDRCTRAGVALSVDTLHALFPGNYAQHWHQSVAFLHIVAETWPLLEHELGETSAAAREIAMLQALHAHWQQHPPRYPVIAIGSTGSQPATAALLTTIAAMAQGAVMLPGLDPRQSDAEWQAVTAGHPYMHLKALLAQSGVALGDVNMLGDAAPPPSLWLSALGDAASMAEWRQQPLAPYGHLQICACQHAEEEALVIALAMRHGLEEARGRIALVTPDESLMARVAAQLQRFGLQANRLSHGTLAQSEAGSAYQLLLEAIESPEALQPLITLLRHPLSGIDRAWLTMFEQQARGLSTHRIGQLPHLPSALRSGDAYETAHAFAQSLAELARGRFPASQWIERCTLLLTRIMPIAGQGQGPVHEALEGLSDADLLSDLDSYACAGLLRRALDAPWRAPQFKAHPRLFMLTPIEARLQFFDRVILGNMQDGVWPGLRSQSPWLNRSQQEQLGLPGAEEHSALMAHDVLLLGSMPRVLLTHRLRDGGSPAARSRYLERLVTLLATHGIDEAVIACDTYRAVARTIDAAPHYAPAEPPQPRPGVRPASLPVSALDALFSDPYQLYARYVLHLRALDPLDAEPEPRDFGTLAHRALHRLTETWNQTGQGLDPEALAVLADSVLAPLAARPNVQLFWRTRLLAALAFVNQQEALRRHDDTAVQSEVPVEGRIGGCSLVLHGRIDRLEPGIVVDYKTGKPPSKKEMLEGRAVQLLAYAMLLAERGAPPAALEYWGLPAGKRESSIEWLEWTPELASDLGTKLTRVLQQFLDPATPLLARPIASNERFDNDYDGISRYDEWAG